MLHKKPNCESLNQNTCPVLDAEEIKKQAQKEEQKVNNGELTILKGLKRNKELTDIEFGKKRQRPETVQLFDD